MHDPRVLRENFDAIRTRLGPRAADVPWEDLRKLLDERRTLTVKVEELRHQLKKGSEEIARLKRGRQAADALMAAMKELGDRIKQLEEALRVAEEGMTEIALRIPNLPHGSVAAGRDSADN